MAQPRGTDTNTSVPFRVRVKAAAHVVQLSRGGHRRTVAVRLLAIVSTCTIRSAEMGNDDLTGSALAEPGLQTVRD